MIGQRTSAFFLNLLLKLWFAGNLIYVTYSVLFGSVLSKYYLFAICVSTALYVLGIIVCIVFAALSWIMNNGDD